MTTNNETNVFDLLVTMGNEVQKLWQMKLPKCSLHPDGTVPHRSLHLSSHRCHGASPHSLKHQALHPALLLDLLHPHCNNDPMICLLGTIPQQ